MATLNLGAIRYNWKGAYNGSTAYVVNDVVSANGNSYICIQAGTGQAVGNATAYWNIMSSAGTNGTNGTNGTDVGTVITTQGDILYRDGSGLQRLPKGTAGQVLQMNSGATAPEYGTVSSDFVKLIDQDISSVVTGVNVTGWIDNTTYQSYLIRLNRITMNAEDKFRFSWINNSGSPINTGSSYKHQTDHDYMGADNSSNTNIHAETGAPGFQFTTNNFGTSYWRTVEICVSALELNSSGGTAIMFQCISRETGSQIDYGDGFGWYTGNDTFTNSSAGFLLDRMNAGSFNGGNISVYGLK
ncbi:putative carbohydrate binding domain containing protein [uncultured Mediterranean phage uvMED]|nr:putative carbohydrate binding domain containing protein [uncultured Mediterranean phage uvMED]BAR17645.1 putative carbohydrate binding domain containing protein [uncultured Mediterranean phage uvMED]BAR17696.1 putative carbohydrate binding domain containing protein [uncultured Mediterranean phage uvMED]